MTTNKRKIFVLVGMPASGKSTWVKHTFDRAESDFHLENFAVISSDDIIESKAAKEGKTYNEVFSKYSAFANKKIYEDAEKWFNYDMEWFQGVIWDQTNLGKKKRASILKMVPDDWEKICVVLKKPEDKVWKVRLASRQGKIIPEDVLIKMEKSYEEPTEEEGFDRVIEFSGEQETWSG